jgi:predicted transcriptional regulator
MHLLAESLYKDTNMIYYKRNKKYYPADIDDIATIIGLNQRNAKDFISRMMQLGIIAKVIVNSQESIQIQYYVNPLYFNTAKYLSPSLYMLFYKQLNKHLPDWVIAKYHDR